MNTVGRKNASSTQERDMFVTRLRGLMTRDHVRVKDLVDHLGISHQAISRLMTKQNLPSFETIAGMARFFNVSADYLLGLSDVTTVDTELQAVCEYTGLSEAVVKALHDRKTLSLDVSVGDVVNWLSEHMLGVKD